MAAWDARPLRRDLKARFTCRPVGVKRLFNSSTLSHAPYVKMS